MTPDAPKSTRLADVRQLETAAAGPDGSEAIERLFALTADSARQVRAAATDALVRLAARTPAGGESLLGHLTDGRSRARLRAAAVLRRIGASAAYPGATERLLALTGNRLPSLRAIAVETLGATGAATATPSVIDRLLALTYDDDRGVHAAAVTALGHTGAAATPATIERLLGLLAGGMFGAAPALARIAAVSQTERVVAGLVAVTASVNPEIRAAALSALGQVGPASASPPVVARLLELTSDEHRDVRSR